MDEQSSLRSFPVECAACVRFGQVGSCACACVCQLACPDRLCVRTAPVHVQVARPMQDLITNQSGTVSMLLRSSNDNTSLLALKSAISAYQGQGATVDLT